MKNQKFLMQTFSNHINIPVEHIQLDRKITELVADSFLLIELFLNLQETLKIELEQEDLEEVHTVGELLELLEQKMTSSPETV